MFRRMDLLGTIPTPRSRRPRVTGDLRSGDIITNSSTATQALSRTADLNVSVSAGVVDSDATSGDSAGDTIEYTIKLGNNGTTTLSDISAFSALLLGQLSRYGRR